MACGVWFRPARAWDGMRRSFSVVAQCLDILRRCRFWAFRYYCLLHLIFAEKSLPVSSWPFAAQSNHAHPFCSWSHFTNSLFCAGCHAGSRKDNIMYFFTTDISQDAIYEMWTKSFWRPIISRIVNSTNDLDNFRAHFRRPRSARPPPPQWVAWRATARMTCTWFCVVILVEWKYM